MVIAVDFDGTLHGAEFPAIGNPLPGAARMMQRLKDDGHYIILWKCREDNHLAAALDWMDMHRIPFDGVNDHKPGAADQFGYAACKVYADVYIDDRQVGGLPSWIDIYGYVRSLASINHSCPSGRWEFALTDILENAAFCFGVSADALTGRKQTVAVILARHAYCLAARTMTGMSLSAIGKAIDRHHATVLNSCRVARELIETNYEHFPAKYARLKRLLS